MAKRVRPSLFTSRPTVKPAKPAPRGVPRHRMAGSHDGMYVTEHHRAAKKR